MAINRRQVLQLLLSSASSLMLEQFIKSGYFVTSSYRQNKSQLHKINKDNTVKSLTLSFQAHSYLRHPQHQHQWIIIGKRPSDMMALVDLNDMIIKNNIQLPYGRHFYGHGALSRCGGQLFISENDFENEQGLISIWDTSTLQCIKTIDSGGIGPHQLMVNNDRLYCANGGVLTSPLYHRTQLSQAIQSNISIFDINSLQLLQQHQIDHPYMSARHMCKTNNGIMIGFQHKSKKDYQQQPLFMSLGNQQKSYFTHQKSQEIKAGYVTSISYINAQFCAATLHKDDLLLLIDHNNNSIVKSIKLQKPQGLYVNHNNLYVSVTQGLCCIALNDFTVKNLHTDLSSWDNHISS